MFTNMKFNFNRSSQNHLQTTRHMQQGIVTTPNQQFAPSFLAAAVRLQVGEALVHGEHTRAHTPT
jgi:hypothetical protein